MHKIERKIAKLERYLEILRDYKKDCKKRFLNDTMFEDALLHYFIFKKSLPITLLKLLLLETF